MMKAEGGGGLAFAFPGRRRRFMPGLSSCLRGSMPRGCCLPSRGTRAVVTRTLRGLRNLKGYRTYVAPSHVGGQRGKPETGTRSRPVFALATRSLRNIVVLRSRRARRDIIASVTRRAKLLSPGNYKGALQIKKKQGRRGRAWLPAHCYRSEKKTRDGEISRGNGNRWIQGGYFGGYKYFPIPCHGKLWEMHQGRERSDDCEETGKAER